MKLVKGYVLLKQEELLQRAKEQFNEGIDVGAKDAQNRIKNLQKANKKAEDRIEELESQIEHNDKLYERSVSKLEAQLEVLEEDRDDVAETVKLRLEAEDLKAIQDARKEAFDRREASLKDRESKLESKEEGRYKVGYADGVADGVRKINEITSKDRENAMKVAMVAAASHTDPRAVKEATNALQLTEGTKDSESK